METEPDDLYGNYGWELTHQSTKETRINEIAFYSDELGAYIQSAGDTIDSYIGLTIDEGVTWTEISQIERFDAEGIAFPGLTTIYVVGSSGDVFKGKITNDNETGLGNRTKIEEKIYPNPAKNNCTIMLPDNLSSTKVNIVNVHGITQKTNYTVKDQQIELTDISLLPKGIYFIQLLDTEGNAISQSKLMKD